MTNQDSSGSNQAAPQFSTPNVSKDNANTNPFFAEEETGSQHDSNNNTVSKKKQAPSVRMENGSKISGDDDPLKIETLIISTKDEENASTGRLGNSSPAVKSKSSLNSMQTSMTTMAKSEPAAVVTAKSNTKSSSFFNSASSHSNQANEDDDDQIDWASSEDDEIVKQEVESFERNQVSLFYYFLLENYN